MDPELSYKSVDLKAAETAPSRYKILEPLGKGGMACVYKATQLSTGREVALKFIASKDDNQRNTDREIQGFREEVAAISQMAHPNVVSIVDFDTDEKGQPF